MIRKSLSLLVLAGLLASFSLLAAAYFTAQATVANNQFTAGTLDLTASPASSLFTVSNMVPFQNHSAPLTLTNSGSLPLRYGMITSTTNPDGKGLASQMSLTIYTEYDQCVSPVPSGAGATIYGTDPLIGAAFGDPAPGGQAGDRVLLPGASEELCFNIGLNADTPNEAQGATTTVTFTFVAEQLANNP
jgi:predicted ribosomally synthesized peptide with SipW-like signal peptide